MGFKNYLIKEKFFKVYDENNQWDEVFINPSQTEIRNLPSYKLHKELKGVIFERDVYVWGGSSSPAHHIDIVENMLEGYFNDSVPFYYHGTTNTVEFPKYGKFDENKKGALLDIQVMEPYLKRAFGSEVKYDIFNSTADDLETNVLNK